MKTGKKDSCRLCRDCFDRCSECMEASTKLKLKYRLGLTPGRITSKRSNSGTDKGKLRVRNRPNPSKDYFAG